jgi:translation initiation factor 1
LNQIHYMAKDWKDRLGVVFSTNPDFDYIKNDQDESETLTPDQQILKVSLDKKQRKGKTVTLIQGFVGQNKDLIELGRQLKVQCGVGGSVKEGDVILQGDCRDKASAFLRELRYKVK